jgi:uncharacterized membrane protein
MQLTNITRKTLLQILASAVLLVLIDSIYLNLVGSYFRKQVYKVQKSEMRVNFTGAILCYIFLIFGLNYFILSSGKSVLDAFLFGLVIYAVYETTSYALLSDWSFMTVIIDTVWGGILFAITTYIIRVLL